MNQQLIPIIAAYWGAECSYDFNDAVPFLDEKEDWGGANGPVDEQTVYRLVNFGEEDFKNFKLHLRPLWSITEDELRELGVVLGLKNIDINLSGIDEFWRVLPAKQIFTNINEDYFTVYEDNTFDLGFGQGCTKAINKLREWGFCVDHELVDAGLVEWKEVGNDPL